MNNAKTPVRAAGPACNGYQKPAVKFPAKPVEEVANEWPVLEVTQAEAWPLAAPTGKTLGFASVVIGGQIALRDIRVVDGSKGLFAAFPQQHLFKEMGIQFFSGIAPVQGISQRTDQKDSHQVNGDAPADFPVMSADP